MTTTTTLETTGKQPAIRALAEAELEAVNGGSIFGVVRDAFYGAIGDGNVANIARAYAAGFIAGAR